MNAIVLLLMLAVAAILVAGLFLMMRGGEMNRRYGNKLMVARVGLQGLVVALLGVMFLLKH